MRRTLSGNISTWRCAALGLLIVSALCLAGVQANAQTFADQASDLLRRHNLIKAAEADVVGARERARVALGAWFPNMNLTSFYGHEEQLQPDADNTSLATREFDVTITQLLWDFGAANSTIRTAGLVVVQAEAGLNATRQNILLRAVTAYMNILRSQEVLKFAERSEVNIKRQTELENARVERGAGLSTDVLQAKQQLAGAQARRVLAQGALAVARNTYNTVFGVMPTALSAGDRPVVPASMLPADIDEAVAIALDNNFQLEAVNIGNEIAGEIVDTTRSSQLFPRFEVVGDAKFKNDVSGTQGYKREAVGKVQLSFPFNLGFTAINTLNASKSDHVSALKRYGETRDLVEEQIRNAWQNLITARETAGFLGNQADIVAEFLEQARRERQLGRRSLLDVLTGETQLINASSDAASAKADVDIAGFTLLSIMGQLDIDLITQSP